MEKISKKYLDASGGYKIKVETYYDKGGMNYFTHREEKRGIYLSVTPVQIEVTDYGARAESYVGFSGTKKLVKEMGRYSAKICGSFVVDKENEDEVINFVLAKNNLQLI